MIAEIFPEAYDVHGKRVLRPDSRSGKGQRSTLPMGRYVSRPLTVNCKSIADVRRFLRTCKYVSDQAQFGKKDYWQPPEEFEQTKKGDCDCFALWTWRAFLALGYDARFVTGRSGRYGEGHAWVQFSRNGRDFLVEPILARVRYPMPRLSTLRYRPKYSVAWDGSKLSYYSHEDRSCDPPFLKLIPLVADWLIFWVWVWTRMLLRLPYRLYCRMRSRSPALLKYREL